MENAEIIAHFPKKYDIVKSSRDGPNHRTEEEKSPSTLLRRKLQARDGASDVHDDDDDDGELTNKLKMNIEQ